MAVKDKDKKKPVFKQMREAIVQAVDELLEQHGKEIVELYEQSENHKASVRFAAEIDCSESEPMVTTSIRFSTSVTDSRIARLDDPQQITLFRDKKDIPGKDGGETEEENEGSQ